MVCLVLFRDFDPLRRPDRSGFNRVGYLSRRGLVVYDRWRTVRQAPFEHVRQRPHVIKQFTHSFDDTNVEKFFFDNYPSVDLFRQGLDAIAENHTAFFTSPVKLPNLTPISAGEHERRWDMLLSICKPGDTITTFDTMSRMSRLISLLDSSPWSHVGIYIGDGRIAEALTTGYVDRTIDVYRSTRYRLGVYRFDNVPPDAAAMLSAMVGSMVGDGYDYFAAFIIGVRLIFRIKAGGARFRSIGEFLRLADIRLIHVV